MGSDLSYFPPLLARPGESVLYYIRGIQTSILRARRIGGMWGDVDEKEIKGRTKEGRMNLYTVTVKCVSRKTCHGPEQGLDLRGVRYVMRDVE